MFICFHYNKLSSDKKGQLVPVFIVVLVVLIIMSLVTVNLGKLAFFKTQSSNSVDAGALAAGSVMANVFNAVAQSNNKMEQDYLWTFLAPVSVSFALGFALLSEAASDACPSPCSVAGTMSKFVTTVCGIRLAVTGYWWYAHLFYLSIRDMADEGRDTAIEIGHRFSFLNSGIGSALKRGRPPTGPQDIAGNSHNYTSEFNEFLDESLGANSRYTYAWLDGQERRHSVISQIEIRPIKTYNLRVAASPYLLEIGFLNRAQGSAEKAIAALEEACRCFSCCSHDRPDCCACWAEKCAAAEGLIGEIYFPMIAALGGLAPVSEFSSSNRTSDLAFILAWIDDIEHDRLVNSDAWQNHSGIDLAVWETRYPQVHSYSTVNFSGYGRIHPPKLSHDASVVRTDSIGK